MPKSEPPRLELVRVASDAHWHAYHTIRRQVLFEARGRENYDASHPDEQKPGRHPLLLLADGKPVATARLDDGEGRSATVRLVAVVANRQREGLGCALMKRIELLARERDIRCLQAHVAPDAVGFYQRIGWDMVDPDQANPLMQRPVQASPRDPDRG